MSLVKLSNVQLSDAVGSIQLTTEVQLPELKDTTISPGQFSITGGMVSIVAGEQQIAPPDLLSPATIVKLPKTSPTKAWEPQTVDIVALGSPLTDKDAFGPTNFSLGREPVKVKDAPGRTLPENTVPNWSDAVMRLSVAPLNFNVRLVRPPAQVAQFVAVGQSQLWLRPDELMPNKTPARSTDLMIEV